MSLITVKRGDTLTFSVTFTDGAGLPLTNIKNKIRSQIRDYSDKLIESLQIAETDTPGEYIFQSFNTESWPVKPLYFDIEYKGFDGVVVSTQTYSITVERDISHD